MTDAAEYEEAGAAVAGAATTGGRARASAGSRVAAKEGSKSGFAVRGAGLGGNELKFGLGGLTGEAWENLTGVESEDAANEGYGRFKGLLWRGRFVFGFSPRRGRAAALAIAQDVSTLFPE